MKINQTLKLKKGFDRRIRFLIFHYTAQNFADSMNSFSTGKVSAHYLIPNPDDFSYKKLGFLPNEIFELVDEKNRAWHAGKSFWKGRTNLNDSSIGIEIVNEAKDENGQFTFPEFHPLQIRQLIHLTQQILKRNPEILPQNILAHSDISIGRKSDPGAAFPWEFLAKNGIGIWFDENRKNFFQKKFKNEGSPNQKTILENLGMFGYETDFIQNQTDFSQLIRAFQLHFRQKNYDGILDLETCAILFALIEKI